MSTSVVPVNCFSGYLVPNIASLVSVKLENHNYLLWKSQFLPVLCAHGMIGYADESNLCPDEFIVSSNDLNMKEVNPLFLAWIQQDQVVLCLINATLSDGVLARVVGLQTSHEVWFTLEMCFATLFRSHIIQLKSHLQSIKKGSLSMDDCVKKIKHIADSLAAICNPVDDEDILSYTLNGLPPEYGPFKTSIRTQFTPILLEELHVLIQYE
eukprot:TRINITY_DN12435_c0_g3_i1.p1 TRINITY_DN12435_c0_g3~~TRINITY_DN12435_c0_g3_i1.p1  ORF type:complete len:211 (-),score=36.17 TRINITY_DN12435_c0_g3_i1:3813-4445(-)